VVDMNQGHQDAGTYTIDLTGQLAPGIYYYSVVADNNRMTKKMVVE
jgi:hypothetical protein